MNEEKKIPGLLSGNILKIIACVIMTVDHVGVHLFPQYTVLRIIGRLAFPVFAFFIAEGCKYTRNRERHFLMILLSGLIFMLVEYIFDNSVYVNVFLTFAISIAIIYALDTLKYYVFSENRNAGLIVLSALGFTASIAAAAVMSNYIDFDYGFFGIILPVSASLASFRRETRNVPGFLRALDNRFVKMAFMLPVLIVLSIYSVKSYQFYSIAALALIALYNGERGKYNIKYAFYLYYPLHVAVIFLIRMFIYA